MHDPTAAEYEPVQHRAVALLNGVLRDYADREDYETDLPLRRAHRGLALESRDARERTRHWESACLRGEPATGSEAAVRAELFVDAVQDVYATMPAKTRLEWLTAASRLLDKWLDSDLDKATEATLLAQKAAVLRQRAAFFARTKLTDSSLQVTQALRAAEKAVAIQRDPGTLVQLGLSHWAAGRQASSDVRYKEATVIADEHLREAAVTDRSAALALAFFLRMTFRPEEAQVVMSDCATREGPIRPVLRLAFLAGEACAQEWFALDGELFPEGYAESRSLVQRAVAAGYDSARMSGGLAFLEAIENGGDLGALRAIVIREEGLDWMTVAEAVSRGDQDSVGRALALGIDLGSTWSRLATYVSTFTDDWALAMEMSATAVRLAPHDSVVLTNHARRLIEAGTDDAQARRLLDRAAQMADRRFIWWRKVRRELDGRAARGDDATRKSYAKVASAKDFKTIRRAFMDLQSASDLTPQERGLVFQEIFASACALTVDVGLSAGSYMNKRPGGTRRQFDGYIECAGHGYRVECKWEKDPVHEDALLLFFGGIESTAGAILVSMSGYTEGAIYQAKQELKKRVVLLLHPDEIESVLLSEARLDELIRRRRTWALKRDDPSGPGAINAQETPL